MTVHLRLKIARCLLAGMLVVSLFCAGRGALLLYSLHPRSSAEAFRPVAAEEVSRKAAPFQANTFETNGLFKTVQRQHGDLDLMFSYLESSIWLNWSLAIAGTAVSVLLAFVLAIALGILPSRLQPHAESNGDVPDDLAPHTKA